MPRTIDGHYCPGLVIDVKSETGRPTDAQKARMNALSALGWQTAFTAGIPGIQTPYTQTMTLIFSHLSIDEPTELTDHERYKVLTQRAQKRSARTAKRLMKKAGQDHS